MVLESSCYQITDTRRHSIRYLAYFMPYLKKDLFGQRKHIPRVRRAHSSGAFSNHHHECNGVQRPNQHLLHLGLLSAFYGVFTLTSLLCTNVCKTYILEVESNILPKSVNHLRLTGALRILNTCKVYIM